MRDCDRLHPAAHIHGRAVWWLLAALLAAASAWWYFAPQMLPEFVQQQLPRPLNRNPPLYEWHDAKGQLHVTDKPPKDRPYKTLHFNPDVNVLPSHPARGAEKPRNH